MRRYPFGKFLLSVPDDHSIAQIHAQHVLYDRSFGFILEALGNDHPSGVVIDIGANVGDTAAYVATYLSNPILSVEGSDHFLPYLRINVAEIGGQVTILDTFVRPRPLEHVALGYDEARGTGNLVVRSEASAEDLEARYSSVQELLSRARSIDPDIVLIKSDTDGCDGLLLLELLELASDSVLYVECDTQDRLGGVANGWGKAMEELDERGYSALIFDNFGLPMAVAEARAGTMLRDLSGYIRLQHTMGNVHMYYLDAWLFPAARHQLFTQIAATLRHKFLHPLDLTPSAAG